MNNKVQDGKHISAVFAGGATAGAPGVIGQLPGVHSITVAAGETGVLETRGVFNLSVKGHDGSANAAITAGTKIYYDPEATPVLNIDLDGIFFGYALDPVDAGATTTIRVKLSGGITEPSPVISISSHPASVTVSDGSETSFSVTASGIGLTYQAQVKASGGSTWSDIEGEITNAYEIDEAAVADSGKQYRFKISNARQTIYSNAATLTVLAAIEITVQPENSSVAEGAPSSFSVTATGGGTLAYQAQVKLSGGSTWADIEGETTNTYEIAAAALADSGNQYRFKISNAAEIKYSDAATLTVTGE